MPCENGGCARSRHVAQVPGSAAIALGIGSELPSPPPRLWPHVTNAPCGPGGALRNRGCCLRARFPGCNPDRFREKSCCVRSATPLSLHSPAPETWHQVLLSTLGTFHHTPPHQFKSPPAQEVPCLRTWISSGTATSTSARCPRCSTEMPLGDSIFEPSELVEAGPAGLCILL